MTKLVVTFAVLLAGFTPGFSQQVSQQLKIVFYNAENLFDTIDDPHKNDNEFLPASEKAWNGDRYTQKLANVGRVLIAIDSLNLPAVIGFAEVENRRVLEDLVQTTPLREAPYEVILEEGTDPRGIDVGLIYRTDNLTYISHRAIPSSATSKTRDNLYVKLLGPAGDTLHIFVNHWKSRTGGAEKTLPKRLENASTLRQLVDSLFAMNAFMRIIIMGDLNDEPADSSVSTALHALRVEKKPASENLYNLFYESYLEGDGTLWYRGWALFDQIIVSGSLLSKKRGTIPVINPPEGTIFRRPWMLERQGKAGSGKPLSGGEKEAVPLRSYDSKRGYLGGFSDHLPVYITLQY